MTPPGSLATQLEGRVDFESFLDAPIQSPTTGLPSLSLFSGAGIGDLGFERAGFKFHVFAELNRERLRLCRLNHSDAEYIEGDLRTTWQAAVDAYVKRSGVEAPSLLSAMIPCQAMSCVNAWSGLPTKGSYSMDPRNQLGFVLSKVANRLRPRVVVIENVTGIFSTRVRDPDLRKTDTVAQLLVDRLPDYECWPAVVQFADYGVPQRRTRALLTFIRSKDPASKKLDAGDSFPYPEPSHDRLGRNGKRRWVTARSFLGSQTYRRLDSRDSRHARDSSDPLHFVPVYDADRYDLIRFIPPSSGRSAFETDLCLRCGAVGHPPRAAKCGVCGAALTTRPVVVGPRGGARLIIGSRTTYKRMTPALPIATITTANGHIGSDAKIHPWENRLLSPRECADAQSIPRNFRWAESGSTVTTSLVRECTGEAIPPWFTWQQGRVLHGLLSTR